MPLGTYKSQLYLTQQQCENDDLHGILQNSTRSIDFTETTFKYTFHYRHCVSAFILPSRNILSLINFLYYYQYENSSYKIIDRQFNDTVFSGTYAIEQGRIVATVTNGQQKARDQVKRKNLGVPGNIEGKIVFSEDGDILKVISCQLSPKKLNMIESIVAPNLVFKLVK